MSTDLPAGSLAHRLAAETPKLRGRLLARQPLAPLTWFRVGGPAEVLFTPADEDDLAYFLSHCPTEVAVTTIGVGSNLIVRDGGVPGVTIRLSPKGFGQVSAVSRTEIQAGAAALDRKVAEVALAAGIDGLAFYAGIPGTIGGALRMNAGANGSETKDVLAYATGVTREGDMDTFSLAEMGFQYRTCGIDPSVIFTGALFRGTEAPRTTIEAKMEAVRAHRESAQPVREKTGGSTFKNPPGLSAWKLIDAAGLRGFRLGGAMVSEMHTNFLINAGDATAADIEQLGETVRARVRDHAGIDLQWEIKRIGVA
jgi:UDP-N-acetylmuramate dehydrogenase